MSPLTTHVRRGEYLGWEVFLLQYSPLLSPKAIILSKAHRAVVSIMAKGHIVA